MSSPKRTEVDIFDHEDYVPWLGELFKHRDMRFNYSTVARRIGAKSRGYWHNIVRGDRPLSEDLILKLGEVLHLDEEELAYLQALASVRQAPTEEVRRAAELRAAGLRKVRLAARIDAQNAVYLSQWYTAAIREAWSRLGQRPDPAWVAERLVSPIPVEQVEEAVALIERLGLSPGAAAADLSTGHEPPTPVGKVWHDQMLGLAQRAVRELPREERFVDGVAVAVSAKKIQELRRRIQYALQELNQEACSDSDPADEVVVIEIAMVPLMRGLTEDAEG